MEKQRLGVSGMTAAMAAAFIRSAIRPSLDSRRQATRLCGRKRVGAAACARGGGWSAGGDGGLGSNGGAGAEGGAVVVTETGERGILSVVRGDGRRRVRYSASEAEGYESCEVDGAGGGEGEKRTVRKAGIFTRLMEPLLPSDWERCTPGTYVEWVYWRIGRHIFRKAYYVLGTTSLLRSLGVGSTESIAISASLKWVLKDGVAMGTRILVSTNLARLVDESPKRFFFIGDTFKALSVAVEILSLANRDLFLLCGSIAALLKDGGSAMSGPSYRVFLDTFAVCGNIGDVSSRSEAQEVVGDLLGLGVGVVTAWSLSNLSDSSNGLIPTFVCYIILVALHLSCTARAVSLVELRTLNLQRVDRVLTQFVDDGTVPTVEQANRGERFVWAWRVSEDGRRTRLGGSVREFGSAASVRAIRVGMERGDRFAVVYEGGRAGLLIEEGAGVEDILMGTLQARKLVRSFGEDEEMDATRLEDALKESYRWAGAQVTPLMRCLKAGGWSTDRVMFGRDFRYRCETAGGVESVEAVAEG